MTYAPCKNALTNGVAQSYPSDEDGVFPGSEIEPVQIGLKVGSISVWWLVVLVRKRKGGKAMYVTASTQDTEQMCHICRAEIKSSKDHHFYAHRFFRLTVQIVINT